MAYSTVLRELGYPSRQGLIKWYKEYIEYGDLHKESRRGRGKSYSDKERNTAINYYLEHGKCIAKTCAKLGYPSRTKLSVWISEMVPEQKRHCNSGGYNIKYTREQKEQAVISLCSRESSAQVVAVKYGVTREVLYNWKRQLLSEGKVQSMKSSSKAASKKNLVEQNNELQESNAELAKERDILKQEVHRLQLEKDILEKASEIIKKEQGVSISTLTNREKAIVINALRSRYSLKELLELLKMAKSSYCYQVMAITTDKYQYLGLEIQKIFEESLQSYGYRRIHMELKNHGIVISEKIVRRIMREKNLVVTYIRKKKYNSYKGEITPAVSNIIKRDFHADKPNSKWLTDITEFHIPAGKIYLSPIIDCFDGLPISWTIGTSPDAELVNTMLDTAIDHLADNEKPIIHSDRGCHYRWPGWIERMEKRGLTRSMSKKGCSPDNSACEGFFGRLKNEIFYGRSWTNVTVEEFINKIDTYIRWYAEKRIKLSLGGMSPLNYRKSLGLVV